MWSFEQLNELAQKTFWGVPVTVEHMHGTLKGNLHLPPECFAGGASAPAPGVTYPAMLLLHGLGGNRHEHGGLFLKTAATLAQAGFIVLRVDFRGAGETGGSSLDLTIETQIQDANDAFQHLLEYKLVDPERVGVLGLSFGGLTAACLSGKRDDIAALVLWEAAFDMKATLKRLFGPLSLKAVRSRGYMQAGMLQLSPEFFDALDRTQPDQLIADYSRHVLIVQGIADTVVPVDTAYEWRRSFKNTDAEVLLIPDADHAFTRDVWAHPVIKKTVQWLNEHL